MTQRLKPQIIFLWVLWYSLFSACIGYPFILGSGWPAGANPAGSLHTYIYLLGYGSIVISCLLRWIIMPKFHSFESVLVCAIVGMALSEAVVFYGLFLVEPAFADTRRQFFILGIFGVGQYFPIYARNLKCSKNP